MPGRVVLIVNPTAGRGAGRRLGEQVSTLLRASGHEVVDASAGDAEAARVAGARALADGAEALVVVGGDGMVHLGVNLCAETPTRLAVVAAGTGNDVATHLGLPVHDAVAAVAVVDAGHTRRIDAGRVTAADGSVRWFAGVLGAGFDAVVADRAARTAWPRGRSRYVLSVLRELPVFRPIPYSLTLDGARVDTRAMLVAVANTRSFGGGMQVCPDADPADGWFDVLLVRALSLPAFLLVFPRVYSGRHLGHPAVEVRRARHVRLEAPGIRAQADGEMVGALPLDVEVVPDALTVLVPADPPGTSNPREATSRRFTRRAAISRRITRREATSRPPGQPGSTTHRTDDPATDGTAP
ncbi:diacylglycerol/lipid kinase family protein [Terracoccus luteus]|uniref:Diacylglycerol kinase (ATP) n=1 Tax=Terracoccus luteus TaxID=53356 RepID=A0A839PU05_9MICO|nr:YegS/Rv2252/BmrU family lipid kinase [Terracoccus luteus]MBB2987630.1 diacylglycerol kinase (ATP) [Terracoccus luteus]MCP2173281.1 diacylglycerol kinase (ATP) [Terracoccus luteus]